MLMKNLSVTFEQKQNLKNRKQIKLNFDTTKN